jgi:hypothetical protein
MNRVELNEAHVCEPSCGAEIDNCECSSCANLSRCVVNLVVLTATYVSERSCCAEVNDCV